MLMLNIETVLRGKSLRSGRLWSDADKDFVGKSADVSRWTPTAAEAQSLPGSTSRGREPEQRGGFLSGGEL